MALSQNEAAGMTVNERLFAAGLVTSFDRALERRDVDALRRILAAVYVDESSISSTIERVLHPEWPVAIEVGRRFKPQDWQQATKILGEATLPFLEGADRALDLARVKMAIIKLASGDVSKLGQWVAEAKADWRDVLVAAGLAEADWREVLARDGFAVPGGGRSSG